MKDSDEKDLKKESLPSPKGEEKAPVKKDFKLNDRNVPMSRKNRIFGDGKDWFDTHVEVLSFSGDTEKDKEFSKKFKAKLKEEVKKKLTNDLVKRKEVKND